jgi:hypothetical protein
MQNPVFNRLLQAQEQLVLSAVALGSEGARIGYAIDAAERAGRPTDDLAAALSENHAHLELANERIASARHLLAVAEARSLG